ncbi:PIN domain-containing protein [Scytonema sp. UIC 10036]|uniref:PIN domain-containing protein n=1 Tax=Scytonema sp. UIC 10036 TaxID=2304196 RepID=UPI0012DA5AE3|nr:PIN domain-containing protein [Scytonema sp. UIC 10036]MUG95989.1 PIN domain-containing protein [Scytonema sp. UIC 10036]
MTPVLRLCLDLNIWCAALLADKKGRQNTASQCLVEIARQGNCVLSPVQLVISWGMLNRLHLVLERSFHIPQLVADGYIDTIRKYAELGPSGVGPHLTLGGTGLVTLRDGEDAHVLEAAIAGRAKVLVTGNFKDFISNNDTQIVEMGRHAIHTTATHTLHIAHPEKMMNWLRIREIPDLLL